MGNVVGLEDFHVAAVEFEGPAVGEGEDKGRVGEGDLILAGLVIFPLVAADLLGRVVRGAVVEEADDGVCAAGRVGRVEVEEHCCGLFSQWCWLGYWLGNSCWLGDRLGGGLGDWLGGRLSYRLSGGLGNRLGDRLGGSRLGKNTGADYRLSDRLSDRLAIRYAKDSGKGGGGTQDSCGGGLGRLAYQRAWQ